MELNIVRQQLGSRRRALLFYALGVFVYGLFVIAVYPSISKSGFAQGFEQLPDTFKTLFGNNPLGSPEAYLAVEYFGFVWVIILAAFTIGLTSVLSGGVEDGTLELLLANPVRRRSVALGTYASVSAGALFLTVFTYLGVALTAIASNLHFPYLRLLAFCFEAFLFVLAIGGFSLMVAALSSTRGRTYFFSVTFLVVSYLLHFLAVSWQSIHFLDYISIFRYYNPSGVLTGTASIWIAVAVFAGIAAVTAAIGILSFQRRDLRF